MGRGQKNLDLLDRACQALAAAARRQVPDEASLPMSIEIGSHRAGFNINNAGGFGWMDNRHLVKFSVNWPTAKVTFFSDKLRIKALILSTEIEYRKIEEISCLWFLPMVFVVRHRQPDVLPTVILNGIGLGAKIKRLNEEHRLGLKLRY